MHFLKSVEHRNLVKALQIFGPLLFLFFSVCREMKAVGARIPGDNDEIHTDGAADNDDELEAGDGEDGGDEDDNVSCLVRIEKNLHMLHRFLCSNQF